MEIRINKNWCEETLRIKGLKVYTIYNLNNNIPIYFDITGAKTEDITQAKKIIDKDSIKKILHMYLIEVIYKFWMVEYNK